MHVVFRTVLASAGMALVMAGIPSMASASTARETVIQRFDHAITNIPGKSLIAVEVDYPPGGGSLPHHHAHSAFIMAYVITGAVRSQVDDEPARVYHAGETFFEEPGAHHMISANASETDPAKLLAVFVVDTEHGALTTPVKQQ